MREVAGKRLRTMGEVAMTRELGGPRESTSNDCFAGRGSRPRDFYQPG